MRPLIIMALVFTACSDGWQQRADIELEPPVACRYPTAALTPTPPEPPTPPPTPEPAPPMSAAEEEPKAPEPPQPPPEVRTESCLDLNTASAQELTTLPGIGPGRAQKILALRQRRPFRKRSDITRVKGIGKATYRKMKDMLCEL